MNRFENHEKDNRLPMTTKQTVSMKTGVLIHGCNLQAENWRHIAWGDAPGNMGRIPQGLLAAMTMNAVVVVLGTGASRKQFNFAGSPQSGRVLLEAEYSLAFLENRFDDLLKFKAWSDHCPAKDASEWEQLKTSLRQRIVLDIESRNTVGELECAAKVFLERGCNQIVLVSSPTHIVRVLRDASKVYQQDRRYEAFQDNIIAMPSTTCYEGFSAADVVVVEPPHRPDRLTIPTHRRIKRLLDLQQLDSASLSDFMVDFDELLQRYEDLLQNPTLPSVSNAWPIPYTTDDGPNPSNFPLQPINLRS